MASPAPNSDSTPAVRTPVNHLATVSVLLAVGSGFVAFVTVYVLVFTRSIPDPANSVTFLVLYPVCLLASLAAIVIGGLALGRAKRYSPEHALRGTAIFGLILGIIVTIPLVFPGAIIFLFTYACTVGGNCIG